MATPSLPRLLAAAALASAASLTAASPALAAPNAAPPPPLGAPNAAPPPPPGALNAAPPPPPDATAKPPPPGASTPPPPPPRTGKYCLDEPNAKILLTQTLGGQFNPLGSEHQLALFMCAPFTRKPGVLFDYTNFKVGLVNYLSPVYDHMGGFISFAPLSFLELRVEATGLYIWTIPIEGAGYFSFTGYDDDFTEEKRGEREGGSAGGAVVGLSGTLQGAVPLPRGISLLATDNFLAEHWSVGRAPFYYNSRRDVLIAQSDWVAKNTAAVLVEIPLSDNVSVRAGVTDETTFVPRSGYSSNIAAGIATLLVRKIGSTIRNFQPFARVGVYTEHASSTKFRTGEANAVLGVNVVYDLATIEGDDDPGPSPPPLKRPPARVQLQPR